MMPLSVSDYQRGQRYTVVRAERDAALEGVAILLLLSEACHDDRYGDGVHQVKRFYLASYLPSWVQPFIPSQSFYVVEESWNYYPVFCYSLFTCKFVKVEIFSCYINDRGTTHNAFNLESAALERRKVVELDVINDSLGNGKGGKYNMQGYTCEKTQCGPLDKKWIQTQEKVMCSYRLVKSSVSVLGVQHKAESAIIAALRDVLLQTHKDAVIWQDDWFDITIGELIEMERVMIDQSTQQKILDKHDGVVKWDLVSQSAVIDDDDDDDDEFQDARTDL